MPKYRGAYLQTDDQHAPTILTGPEHAELPDDQLIEEAMRVLDQIAATGSLDMTSEELRKHIMIDGECESF